MNGECIYFDNAATSWPKPPSVAEAMDDFMSGIGANPGRSGHRMAVEAGRVVYGARERLSRLFNVDDPLRVVFTQNATDALNLALRGTLRAGDKVVTGSMEHNSVMRPLRDLERAGVGVEVVQADEAGFLDPEKVRERLDNGTRMLVVNHGSNVVGSLAPIRELGGIARDLGVIFLVDSAQTAGSIPIDMKRDRIDLLAFTGHKALMGPQGTGGLVISDDFDVEMLDRVRSGGSGSRSDSDEHPGYLPDKYEAGTLNAVGIAGLGAGVGFVLGVSVEAVMEKERSLVGAFISGAGGVPGLRLYGGMDPERQSPTVSFNIDGLSQSDIGLYLDDAHGIMCRVGLHCAPMAHRTIGTFPDGTVRFGFGYFNSLEEIARSIEALGQMVSKDV